MVTESLIVQLDADNSKYNKEMKRSGQVTDGFSDKTKKSTKSLKDFNVASVASSVALALATRKVVAYADAYTELTNKLKLATNGTEDLEKTTKKLFDLSNETRSGISDTVTLFAKMERSTRNLNLSQEELLKLTGSINKSFKISGATVAESSGSIRQLGQALQSGALRGEEFNSIAEQAPIIMEAVSAATGKNAGELRKLAAEGKITSEILVKSLQAYSDQIDDEFSTSTATYAQNMEIAQNNAIRFVGTNKAINSVVSAAGKSLVGMSENLDKVALAASIVATVIGGRLAASLLSSAASATTLGLASIAAQGGLLSMAGAARIANGALALLGGPAGALITVVASLALFVDWETDAEKQLKDTNAEIDAQISSIKGLTKAELELQNIKFAKRQRENLSAIKDVNAALTIATEKQKELTDQHRQSTPEYAMNARKVVDLKNELSKLFDVQTKIQELGGKIFETQLEDVLPKDEKFSVDLEGGGGDDKLKERLEKFKISQMDELVVLEEKYEKEKELLAGQKEALLLLEDEYLVALAEIQDKQAEKLKKKEDKILKIAEKEKKAELKAQTKAEMDKRNLQDLTLNAAMAANTMLFNDNKAVAQGIIVADAAIAIGRQFADLPFPAALASSVIIAANAAAQLSAAKSASRGGGSISAVGGGGGGVSAEAADTPEPEASSLEFTEQGANSNTMRIVLSGDNGEVLMDSIATSMADRERQGR